MRGEGVGVGLAPAGSGVVGTGIVVALGEELADGRGATHATSSKAMRIAAPRVTRENGLSSVGVF